MSVGLLKKVNPEFQQQKYFRECQVSWEISNCSWKVEHFKEPTIFLNPETFKWNNACISLVPLPLLGVYLPQDFISWWTVAAQCEGSQCFMGYTVPSIKNVWEVFQSTKISMLDAVSKQNVSFQLYFKVFPQSFWTLRTLNKINYFSLNLKVS